MRLGLFAVVVFLSSMNLTGSSKAAKGKRQRRSMYDACAGSGNASAGSGVGKGCVLHQHI